MFLNKCKKAFFKYNLTLYKGKYPICREDNRQRKKKYGYKDDGFITEEQLEVCDYLLKNKFLFILEHKINAPIYGDFWCDIYVKGKYHFFGIEVDGKHHSTLKRQRIRDALKEKIIFERHNIFTQRIKNCETNIKKTLEKKLKKLNTRLYTKKNEHIFRAEWLADLICNVCRAKSKKK